jgi:hypothetical protein
MNQTQAIAKLRKLLGPKMGYRVDPKALAAEEREQMLEQSRQLRVQRDELRAARDALRAELLSDPRYVELCKQAKALEEAQMSAYSRATHKRVTVGRVSSLFFHQVADGDNWAEVVEAVQAKEGAEV